MKNTQAKLLFRALSFLAFAAAFSARALEKSPLESYRIDTQYGPKVSVLKSLYDKEDKFQLRFSGNYSPYSSLYSYYGGGAAVSYFWNSRWGWEIINASVYKTQLSSFLAGQDFNGIRSAASIEVPKMRFSSGVLWSPLYAKMHLTEKTMLHFDVLAGLGLGWSKNTKMNLSGVSLKDEQSFGGSLKTGLRIWLPPRWTLELELEDFMSSMQDFSKSSLHHSLAMNFSLGIFFGSF